MQAARNTIMKGTEVCSKNEDVWLEAIRLQVCKRCSYHTITAYSRFVKSGYYKYMHMYYKYMYMHMYTNVCITSIIYIHSNIL